MHTNQRFGAGTNLTVNEISHCQAIINGYAENRMINGDEDGMKKLSVDVVIPTYKPGEEFETTLKMLLSQTKQPDHIFVMNTEPAFWKESFQRLDSKIIVTHIKKEEFDHGGTRSEGAAKSVADILLFMTQDAVPADCQLIEQLLKYFQREKTAAVYARQLPKKGCSPLEAYTRKFNYPEQSRVKTKADLQTLGIKTFFCSNVCAAYRRDIFEERNGFFRPSIFNEDMIYCGGLIQDGYEVCYGADAKVYHSHNYSPLEQLKRNFDLGVSQAEHPEIFSGISSENEGIKMVKDTALHFIKVKKPWVILSLVIQSGFKFLGYRLGKNYKKLSRKTILKLTCSRNYWLKEE